MNGKMSKFCHALKMTTKQKKEFKKLPHTEKGKLRTKHKQMRLKQAA